MICTTHVVGRCSSNSETLACSTMHMSQSSFSANSVSSICQCFGQWIALRWKFEEPETPKKIAPRKALWLALSLNHGVADVLAEDF